MNALSHRSFAANDGLTRHVEDLPVLAKRPNAPTVRREAAPARPWLITIVDLMTILLTFFVLLFSLSKIDMVRFIPVARSYADAFAGGLPEDSAPRLPEVAASPGDNLSYLDAVLRPAFAGHASLADVQFRVTAQYIILTWPVTDPGAALFDAGSSGLSEAARRRIFDLGGVLNNLHNRIAVVGQAAPAPPPAGGGQDNDAQAWRLAIARANTIADALAASGYAREITVLGRDAALGNAAQVQILIMPERPPS